MSAYLLHPLRVSNLFLLRKKFICRYYSYPHGFKTGDDINISGLSTSFDNFNTSYRVIVNTNTLNLTLGISSAQTTGIVTYFYVAGNLTPEFCRENDVFQINYSDTFEKIKVLNVDFDTKRIT